MLFILIPYKDKGNNDTCQVESKEKEKRYSVGIAK
jgi:hypothetical protein